MVLGKFFLYGVAEAFAFSVKCVGFDAVIFDVFSEVGFELGVVAGDNLAYWGEHQSGIEDAKMAGVAAVGVWYGEGDGVASAFVDGGEDIAFEVVQVVYALILPLLASTGVFMSSMFMPPVCCDAVALSCLDYR